MNKTAKTILIALVATVFLTSSVSACIVSWETKANLEQKADAVVIARIIDARYVGSSFRGEDYEYRVNVERSERGNIQLGAHMVRYEDLMAGVRGGAIVCPVKNGSDIEHDLKPGKVYRLYLTSGGTPEILLAEPNVGER